ncbi:hypothetical protein ACI65C_010216 [Semiaphis heraclei]
MSHINRMSGLTHYKTLNPALKIPKQVLHMQNRVCSHTGRRDFTSIPALICGSAVRRWWSKSILPETRQRLKDIAWTYRLAITATITAGLCLIGTFLSFHTELDPWTNLWRLFILSDRTIEVNADEQVAYILGVMGKCCLLETEHPTYKRVAGVTSRLLNANAKVDEIRKRHWSVVVLKHPAINAFVMANGFIFVFSGLAAVANDDQLSIIVGHELAHCVLRHWNHYTSVKLVINVWMVLVSAVLSIALPFRQALAAVAMCKIVFHLCVGLPTQRSHETEADRVGLELAANACIDVTQGYKFWETLYKANGPSTRIWWLETHPTDKTRAQHLYSLIPATVELQKQAGC